MIRGAIPLEFSEKPGEKNHSDLNATGGLEGLFVVKQLPRNQSGKLNIPVDELPGYEASGKKQLVGVVVFVAEEGEQEQHVVPG